MKKDSRRIGVGTRWIIGCLGALAVGGAAIGPAAAAEVVNGKLNVHFHFQYFPTASDISSLKTQIQRAQLSSATLPTAQ